jgi:segregation and condensation protein B
MPSKLDTLVLEIEAVLFAAGKPLSAHEIAGALGSDDPRAVARAVRTLEATYGNRQSSLEVRRVGDRFALQLQERFVPVVHAVTPVEMAPRTLKALTLIAYHQPVLQSVLVRMIGDVAYEEVQHLRGLGLVRTEPKGSTLELSTTRRFAEYFGIPSGRADEIRRVLADKLGVTASGPAAPVSDVAGPPGPPPDERSDGDGSSTDHRPVADPSDGGSGTRPADRPVEAT